MRRTSFPGSIAAVALFLLLAIACTPAAQPSPTTAPAKAAPTSAPAKPASQPAPTTAPAKEGPAPATKGEAKPAAKSPFDEQAVADFYRGKTVKIIVGAAAGGGYDTYSRVIARHLGKYIPGNPTVIVENMPGAGTILAANHVYNVAPKDGTHIANVFGTLVLEQLFDTPGIEFDFAKFQPIAVPVAETYLVIVPERVGVTKLEEMLGPNGKEVVFGGIPGSTVEHAPLLLREALGANVKVVSGYTGTSQVRLAMDRGEVDAFVNTWQSVKITNRAEIDSGAWRILLQLSDKPVEGLPGQVPTILDITQSEEQRQLLLFGTAYPNQFGKVYFVAPEVPPDRVAALEAAFLKTMQDKEFLADAEQSQLEIAPLGRSEVRRLIDEMLNMPAGIRDKLQQIMKPAS